MGKYLKREINTVFIMLGNKCNMNCVYCLQHPLVAEQIQEEINPEIYDFLCEIAYENTGHQLYIQFYGGEPLLYFDNIKTIVNTLNKRNGIIFEYGIISNGRAITDEMVSFFNKNNIKVTISWDGYSVLETRLFDVFSDLIQKERILKIKYLGLSGVISSKSYPKEMLKAFQEISNEYYGIHGYQIRINLDEIFDTGISNKHILDVDYNRIENEITEMIDVYIKELSGKNDQNNYTKFIYIDGLIKMLKNFYSNNNGEWKNYTAACGNGLTVLNLDIQGNLYPCHNTSQKAGNINDKFFKYLNKILSTDTTILNRDKCKNCIGLAFCMGGCKLVNNDARANGYCKLKQSIISPIINYLQKLGSKLESEQ